ncbi:hypothetical protein GCM10010174_05930 [Kutzneria viridogrisea]|uniref:Uncharacterized protein n=2 Tax=Kutzneria TaxID=43356 RepID=W5WBR9_9PSEU|nr:hypothetical protein [Kutzneria albida]AHH97996.1 hypothetical protein KALB_4634 [Kutzneria albida DSM 43870]MBA8924347.1 hypothetical protein [Kutzneria viridogrisea]
MTAAIACAECTQHRSHCHGTLIVHGDGSRECVEPSCRDVHRHRHDLVIDCRAVHGGCRCSR